MKKSSLGLMAIWASVILLAGCNTMTPEVVEEDGSVVVEDTTVIETPEVEEVVLTWEEAVVEATDEVTEATAE